MWLFQSLWWSVFFELRVDSYVQTKLRVIHFEKQILWHPHFDTNICFKKSRGFGPTTEMQLRGKGRGDLSLFQTPVQFVKRSSTLTHVWQTLKSRRKKKLIPKPPSLFLSTATIALFSSSLRFIHWTSVTAQHKPLIWNISNEKRKTNKKQQQQRKKGKTKIFPFSLNECGIRKPGDRFLVGTRNFFSLFHARDKTDNEQIFSIPNYNSLAQFSVTRGSLRPQNHVWRSALLLRTNKLSFPTFMITVQYPPHNTALLHQEIPSLSVYYSN